MQSGLDGVESAKVFGYDLESVYLTLQSLLQLLSCCCIAKAVIGNIQMNECGCVMAKIFIDTEI
jgi:hypothetical protein